MDSVVSVAESSGTAGHGPRWSRRKDARPAEIVEAASDLFVTDGFAATKLADVAKRAGIAKGTLYLYFDTKEALFRAVVRHALADNLAAVERAAGGAGGTLADLVPALLRHAAAGVTGSRIPAILRMVLAESRTFPDIAAIWHDEVASRMLGAFTAVIAAAQARGEVRPGDPRLHAVSILGPMVAGMLFNEVFGASPSIGLDLDALATQHAETVLAGLPATEGV